MACRWCDCDYDAPTGPNFEDSTVHWHVKPVPLDGWTPKTNIHTKNTISTTTTAVMAKRGTTMSNNTFTEEYGSQQPDPTAPNQTVDFHYDEVDRNLAGNPTMDDEDAYREKLTLAMSTLFDWIISDMRPPLIGRRVIAAAWVVNPKRFGNASLRKLAKDLGCSIAHLSEMTAEFSRAFAISNRYQSHDWRKKS